MLQFLKTYWKTLVFFGLVGLIGGFFVGIYALDSYPPELQQQLIAELEKEGLGQLSPNLVIAVISALQAAGYGLVLGAVGIFLGKKIGLWKDERTITRKPLMIAVIVSIIGGMALIVPDVLFFGNYSQVIKDSYAVKPTIPYLLATVTYGAVIEEVMLRLFWMTLVAFLLHKLFEKGKEKTSVTVLVIANVIAAILFAAGHLPTTFMTIGNSAMIIFRCFLLNGIFGLAFGWLYRKWGLRYAMIAHGGCHIVSKLIWILFI